MSFSPLNRLSSHKKFLKNCILSIDLSNIQELPKFMPEEAQIILQTKNIDDLIKERANPVPLTKEIIEKEFNEIAAQHFVTKHIVKPKEQQIEQTEQPAEQNNTNNQGGILHWIGGFFRRPTPQPQTTEPAKEKDEQKSDQNKPQRPPSIKQSNTNTSAEPQKPPIIKLSNKRASTEPKEKKTIFSYDDDSLEDEAYLLMSRNPSLPSKFAIPSSSDEGGSDSEPPDDETLADEMSLLMTTNPVLKKVGKIGNTPAPSKFPKIGSEDEYSD